MSDKTNSTLPAESDAKQTGQVDENRRRLAKAGVVGSGIILTVASRSALGGWGVCTGSEITSGNLSKPGEANPCGCSPGYWGMSPNGIVTWNDLLGTLIPSTYAPTAIFNATFGVEFYKPWANVTLLQAAAQQKVDKIKISCPNGKTIAMHAVAALLNAAVYGDRYPTPYQSPSAVIGAFQTAFGMGGNCETLNGFKDAVDIYDSEGTWCFGDPHTKDT